MPLYFGADGSNMGSVSALPVTSFAQAYRHNGFTSD